MDKVRAEGSPCLILPSHLAQALLCFLDQLEDEDVQTRVAGCLALGCIKVIPAHLPTRRFRCRAVPTCDTDPASVFCPHRLLRALSPWCTCAKQTQKL